jgi:16S rRNA G966 N2-methylase RsmD
MAKGREQFDLILLDPPYTPGLLDEILAALLEAGLPSENAIIICESDEQGIPAPLEGYRQKLHRYGKSYVSVYRREEEEA